MKLTGVQVNHFRNIIDSSYVEIQPDVSCLVGKNESGKTAFLHALYRLLPAKPNVSFYAPDHYPAWLEKRDRLKGVNINEVCPITCTFELESKETIILEEEFGPGVIKGEKLQLSRNYENNIEFSFDIDEAGAVKKFLKDVNIPETIENWMDSFNNFKELSDFLEEIISKADEDPEAATACNKVKSELNTFLDHGDLMAKMGSTIEELLPEFFYFSDYSRLPYSVPIKELLETDPDTLEDGEYTALALLRLAAADDEYLMNPQIMKDGKESLRM